MPSVHSLDDAILIDLWNKVEDRDHLTEYQREIAAEMAERDLVQ